jgi:hypothetical protein
MKYLLAILILAAIWYLPPMTLYYIVAVAGAIAISAGIMRVIEKLDGVN